MRTIYFILRKEFTQLKRNRTMLPIIFIVPLVQLLVLVNAATLELKNISLTVCDYDLSPASRRLTSVFDASPFFNVHKYSFSTDEAISHIENSSSDMVLVIPRGFETKMVRENKAEVQMLFNAINGTVAGIGNAYANQIFIQTSKAYFMEFAGLTSGQLNTLNINAIPAFWYNPDMNYKVFMVPAILVILVTIIGMMLAAMNIVREKEMGTIEQINVTPIKKIHFIIGKLLPFWIVALVMLAFGLFVGKIVFDIPLQGSLVLLFANAAVYLLVMQGFGLLLSDTADTQQQAMFIAFFFLIIFILMGGIFTPIESMPLWAQWLNKLNPIAYFMKIIRMILLKGSTFTDIRTLFLSLSAYAAIVLTIAITKYRKVN
ncbi:MAG: ABC transporter permease [Bacteroidales bacterium]|nr:ABC transporter permease [Bacteroidales bacterium]